MRSLVCRVRRLEIPRDETDCPRCRAHGPPMVRFVIREAREATALPIDPPEYPRRCPMCGTGPTLKFIIAEEAEAA